ncbi:MAG: hypothetical protein U9R25_17525 [Chloroflexota bacterium]|nr:hypothetical protein [Chloroflexota bacterium]
MSLFNKIRSALSGSSSNRPRPMHSVSVRCNRCGEILTPEIDLSNDLSIDYDRNVYHVRKLIMGSGDNRCFQQIEISLTFDQNKHLTDRQISGGTFVDTLEEDDSG